MYIKGYSYKVREPKITVSYILRRNITTRSKKKTILKLVYLVEQGTGNKFSFV